MDTINVTFVAPNTVSQRRAPRFTESTWDKYKEDIVRHYRYGGLANALRWIENQNIPTFHPT
jgi:hypothetical protein